MSKKDEQSGELSLGAAEGRTLTAEDKESLQTIAKAEDESVQEAFGEVVVEAAVTGRDPSDVAREVAAEDSAQ